MENIEIQVEQKYFKRVNRKFKKLEEMTKDNKALCNLVVDLDIITKTKQNKLAELEVLELECYKQSSGKEMIIKLDKAIKFGKHYNKELYKEIEALAILTMPNLKELTIINVID